jgi:hypothetical protein
MKRLVVSLAWMGILVACLAGNAHAAASRVSVQPIEGTNGPDLRKQISRMLRGHGFRVIS